MTLNQVGHGCTFVAHEWWGFNGIIQGCVQKNCGLWLHSMLICTGMGKSGLIPNNQRYGMANAVLQMPPLQRPKLINRPMQLITKLKSFLLKPIHIEVSSYLILLRGYEVLNAAKALTLKGVVGFSTKDLSGGSTR